MKNWQELATSFDRYLCPPGDGVYALTTGKARREHLQAQLYGLKDYTEQKVRELWQASLQTFPNNHYPILLGICSDTGGGIQRGANWGPLYVRQALYQHYAETKVFELGDIRVIPQLLLDEYAAPAVLAQCRQALYGDDNTQAAVSPLSMTYQLLHDLFEFSTDLPVLALGGDHSVTYPVLKAFLAAKKRQQKRVAVIHFDAHTDLLESRLGIDICFATWAYRILPYLQQPQDLVQIGIRASQYEKDHWQRHYGVQQYWATEIHQQGVAAIADAIVCYLTDEDIDEIYITFDIDCLDITQAGATGTPEAQGLTVNQALELMGRISQQATVASADLTEVAPLVNQSQSSQEPQTTLRSAADIAHRLLSLMSP